MTSKPRDVEIEALAADITQTYSPGAITRLMRLIEPAPATALMSNEAFEQVMEVLAGRNIRRPFSEKSVAAVRLVFVKGASVAEAAAEVGLSRQVAHRLIVNMRRRMAELPSDWVKLTEWFPGIVAEQLRDMSASLKAAQANGQRDVQSFTITVSL